MSFGMRWGWLWGAAEVDGFFLKYLSICGNGTFYHTLYFNIALHHLIPLNSTQTPRHLLSHSGTPRHLLSHHCGKADGEFERRDSCRFWEPTCEGLRRWCAVGGRCRFPNQLFLNRLPSPIHPHCSRMVPRPHHCAAGAWRAGNVFLATWSDHGRMRAAQTRHLLSHSGAK